MTQGNFLEGQNDNFVKNIKKDLRDHYKKKFYVFIAIQRIYKRSSENISHFLKRKGKGFEKFCIIG